MKNALKLMIVFALALSFASCGEIHNTPITSSTVSQTKEDIVSVVSKTNDNNSSHQENNSSKLDKQHNSSNVVSHTHEWGKWIHDKFPNTATGELGSSHRTCKICKEVETKELTEQEVHHMFTTDGLIYLQ